MLAELIASLPPSAARARARQLLVKSSTTSRKRSTSSKARWTTRLVTSRSRRRCATCLARQRLWGGDFAGAIADAR